jgi:hypothetical protein
MYIGAGALVRLAGGPDKVRPTNHTAADLKVGPYVQGIAAGVLPGQESGHT